MTAMMLGRYVEHDPRSRAFAHVPHRATQTRTTIWALDAPALDQGNLGSCTGNALAQWFNTHFARSHARSATHARSFLNEQDAIDIYSHATHLDSIPGYYPPTDTGSSGLAVCKAAQRMGLLTGYEHSFGMTHLIATLQHTPVIVGTEWTQDMFTPNPAGLLVPGGDVVGGHEYLVYGVDIEAKHFLMRNSWSSNWGSQGDAFIGFDAMDTLLRAQGDVTVPVI